MTPQEIFNKAYLGLKAQGRKSLSDDAHGSQRCMYAAADGCKCGIGFLVSEEVGTAWDLTMSGIGGILFHEEVGVKPWMHQNRHLLVDIQQAHDMITVWETHFEESFADIARRHNLEVPV